MAQSMLLPRMNLVEEPTMISSSRMRMGQFSILFWNAFAQRKSTGICSVSFQDSVKSRVSSTYTCGAASSHSFFSFFRRSVMTTTEPISWAASGWMDPWITGMILELSVAILSPFAPTSSVNTPNSC